MRRVLLSLLLLPAVLVGGVLVLHGPVVRHYVQRAVVKAEARLGVEIRVGHVGTRGLLGVALDDVRIGPREAPLLTIDRISGEVDREALEAGRPRPAELNVEGVVLHVRGDGTLPGALRALRASLPDPPERARSAADEGGVGALPRVVVRDGRVVDHGGALEVREGSLDFAAGKIVGAFRANLEGRRLERCTYDGDLDGVTVRCGELRRRLPMGLSVAASGVRITRKPALRAAVTGLVVEAVDAEQRVASLLGGMSVDAAVDLLPDAQGKRPLEVRLQLPGGGELRGTGLVDDAGVELKLTVADLPLSAAHPAVSGQASGGIDVHLSRRDRTLKVDGSWRLREVRIDHGAIAEGPIGPFDVDLRGVVEGAVPPDGPPTALHAQLRDARVMLGRVAMDLEAELDNRGAEPKVRLAVDVPRVDATTLVEALPEGLLPQLEPIIARGSFGAKGEVAIDWADLKKTKLDASVDLRKLELAVSPTIDFEALRSVFRTRFEVPEGEDGIVIQTRTTGPETNDWTPLEGMPALLPAAVIAQEDGGFRRHPGVSMLHLRGSLVRNLERGRFARGGSTLTMQLARNLFLNRRKTLSRKLQELVLTWMLEQRFSKDELLELYLNIVEFGDDIYGIREAADHYFEKAPISLTPVEVAFIVRLLPAPRRFGKQFDDRKLKPHYVKWIDRLLSRLVDKGHLSQSAYEAADPESLWQAQREDVPGELR